LAVGGRLSLRLRGWTADSSLSREERTGSLRWVWRLAAFAGGVPLSLAFPRPALWWLGFVAVVPLILVVRGAPTRSEAGIRGWLGGSGFFLGVDSWLLPQAKIFAIPAALILGLLWLPWGRLIWRLLGTSPGTPWEADRPLDFGRLALGLLLIPSVFVLGEVVRSWSALGGPWALLGASQWNNRPILALASLGGVWLVTVVLMAVNLGVAMIVAPRAPWMIRAGSAVAVCGILLLSLAWDAFRPSPPDHGTPVRIALVQPGKIDPVQPRLAASESATMSLRGTNPNLIIWSESSVGRDPATHPADIAAMRNLVKATGSDLLVNVDARRQTGGIFKTSLLIGPDGALASYDKMRLVPFGEYIPARPLLGWVDRFTKAAPINRHHGRHLELMHADGIHFGTLICFESAFPDMSRNLARMGANLIVVQSATTTFQQTWGPQQHAALAAVRAVETGRPVVQASIAGVSAASDPSGHMLTWKPTSFRGAVVVPVHLSNERTVFDRFGDWVPIGAGGALLVAGLLSIARRREQPL
jgi:apolipoprotein N-acyltransferase